MTWLAFNYYKSHWLGSESVLLLIFVVSVTAYICAAATVSVIWATGVLL